MYGMLSNWSMNSVQAPIMDKGFSVLLASADSKPRMILGVSCYASPSGGNTTNVVPVLAMVPSQELAANSVVETNTVPVVYIARSSQPITTTLATTYSPGVLIPYIESRAGGGPFPIVPPGWMLLGVNGDVDADGTIEWQVASCDMG